MRESVGKGSQSVTFSSEIMAERANTTAARSRGQQPLPAPESAAIIEYLDLHHGDAPPLVPADPRLAIEARQMDSVFDDYVMAPLGRMVFNALLPRTNETRRSSSKQRLRWIRATHG
jgi:glutathione S-transferase